MNLLRERLKRICPTLYRAMEPSWEKVASWGFSIPPSLGSYNSLPHFRNIEEHLERLLIPSSVSEDSAELAIPLSALELYLLLASIVFHDVGRIQGDTNHAYASCDLILQRYAELGIPSFEMACSLARISLYHDPVRKPSASAKSGVPASMSTAEDERLAARSELRDVTIEPFGRARELYVATLLTLADHLDCSAMRAEPSYARGDDIIGVKGAFRRMVVGSYYERQTRCVKTCVHNPSASMHLTEEEYSDLSKFSVAVKGFEKTPSSVLEEKMNEGSETRCALYTIMEIQPATIRNLFNYVLVGDCRLDRKADQVPQPWPEDFLLAIVLSDLGINRRFLKWVRNDLMEMGLPMDDWLIEFKDRTYDDQGNEQEEPVFSDPFKTAVAGAMVDLSSQAFGRALFSYQALADRLREPNVDLVRLAVRRLKMKPENHFNSLQFDVHAYPDSWELQWRQPKANAVKTGPL